MCFENKALQTDSIVSKPGRQHLECNLPWQMLIEGKVDFAHAPANERVDEVSTYGTADEGIVGVGRRLRLRLLIVHLRKQRSRLLLSKQQGFDLPAEIVVMHTYGIEEDLPLAHLARESSVKQVFDYLASIGHRNVCTGPLGSKPILPVLRAE